MKRAVYVGGLVIAVAWVILGNAPQAAAYPQFSLTRGQACVECHVSPAGGGLLTEQGLITAEAESKYGHAPELLYGKWQPPDFLRLGGDFRFAGGAAKAAGAVPLVIPMQGELYAAATFGKFTAYLLGGVKGGEPLNPGPTQFLQSREHYLMWQQKPGEAEGWFVRAGRFMPVFGQRYAEHPYFARRFGGSPLHAETYGASVSFVKAGYEMHVSGFVQDPLRQPVQPGSGGALLVEKRFAEKSAVALEAKYQTYTDGTQMWIGGYGKHYLDCRNLLLTAEVLATRQTVAAGGSQTGVVGQVIGSWNPAQAWWVDLGIGHVQQDLSVRGLDRQALDVQARWFLDSHIELIATGRLQMQEHGKGATTGYGLLQMHFRL